MPNPSEYSENKSSAQSRAVGDHGDELLKSHAAIIAPIVVAWDPDILCDEEYALLIRMLGDLVRARGGVGVKRIRQQSCGATTEAEVPV